MSSFISRLSRNTFFILAVTGLGLVVTNIVRGDDLPPITNADTKYCVDPAQGNDANDGLSPQTAFKTIEKARAVVATKLDRPLTGNIRVFLRSDTYALTKTVTFGPGDSGRDGFKVIYQSIPNEKPVISGGKQITGWTLSDRSKNIWKAAVAEDDNFRQIYVNGIKATRARSENAAGWKKTPTGYSTTDTTPYKNVSNMEIVGAPWEWQQVRLPIAAIQNGAVTIQEPCWDIVKTGDYPGYGNPHWIENAYEFMKNPGDWYLDRPAHTLFYIPRPGEDMASALVEVPVVEELFAIAGDADKPVSNLIFSGLDFRLSNWVGPSTGAGWPTIQSNQVTPQSVPEAAFVCTGAHDVEIEHCAFRQLGADGVNVLTACQRVVVDHCLFHDLAAGGVQIGHGSDVDAKWPPDSGNVISNITLSNCTIHDIATDYLCGCGVFVGYVRACTISHNEIYNVPYTGISLGWGWGRVQVHYTSDNKIIGNKIHDHMRLLADGGGIYCNGYEEGPGMISGNYVYNQGNRYGAIYLDDGSTNWTVKDNVVKKANSDEWYLFKGHNNHAMDNFSDDAKIYDLTDKTVPCTLENTTIVKDGNWPGDAVQIMDDSGPK